MKTKTNCIDGRVMHLWSMGACEFCGILRRDWQSKQHSKHLAAARDRYARRKAARLAIAGLCLMATVLTAAPNAMQSRHDARQRVEMTASYANTLADAIRKAEGTWTYGVNVHVANEAEARAVCIRTLKHYYREWNGQGSFIDYAASRYCPAKVDPVGNRNWRRNVKALTIKK